MTEDIEVKEQCKKCFHFQVCANILKQQLYIRELMLKEENPKCEHFVPVAVACGKWEGENFECSACGRCITEICDADSYLSYGIELEMKWCPFCGAKMDGVSNG